MKASEAAAIVEVMPQPGAILERTPRVKCSDDTMTFENPIIPGETVAPEPEIKKYGFEDDTAKKDQSFVEQQTMQIPVIKDKE